MFAFNRGAGSRLGPTFASVPGITPDALVTLTVGPYGSSASGTITDLTTGASQPIAPSSIKIQGPVIRVYLNINQLPSKGWPVQKYRFAFWTQTAPGQRPVIRRELRARRRDDPHRRAQGGGGDTVRKARPEQTESAVVECSFRKERESVSSQNVTLLELVLKTAVAHTVTYFLAGVVAFFLFDYTRLFAETELRFLMRPVSDPMVAAGPLFQPIRGALFGLLFYSCRDSWMGLGRGWLVLWMMLVIVGVIGTFGPAPGCWKG